jgi:hypothetical protein
MDEVWKFKENFVRCKCNWTLDQKPLDCKGCSKKFECDEKSSVPKANRFQTNFETILKSDS